MMTNPLQPLSTNIFIIDDFLTPEACSAFIDQAEAVGFTLADVETKVGRQHLSIVRNNERVDWYSDDLADRWWQQLPKQLPSLEGKQAAGLSPYFRFYKYSPGQKFNFHKDGRQLINGDVTLMTLLVYLNANYTGGTTQFRQDAITVHPSTGTALIFEHSLWHKGSAVDTGAKYVLRTDVIYQ